MDPRPSGVCRAVRVPQRVDARRGRLLRAREQHRDRGRARRELEGEGEERPRAADERGARSSRRRDVARVGRARIRRGAFYTLVPIRPRRRGERRSLRTFPVLRAGPRVFYTLIPIRPRPRAAHRSFSRTSPAPRAFLSARSSVSIPTRRDASRLRLTSPRADSDRRRRREPSWTSPDTAAAAAAAARGTSCRGATRRIARGGGRWTTSRVSSSRWRFWTTFRTTAS